jgi:phosphate transport system substrate-binding protein
MKRLVTVAAVLGLGAGVAWAQQVKVDASIAGYQKQSGVSGNVNSVGSDTMNNLMTLWGETFLKLYPKPTQIRTAYDALAIYVNKDNPLEKLTLAQADAIFSKTRKRGNRQNITTWGQLGLTGDWANRPISLYGRNSASGTYGFFKEHTLAGGDYKDTVKEQPGSASVVQGVTEDRFGIGYSGIGYRTSGVKALMLADKEGGAYSDGNYGDVTSGKYPLNRFLYLYINKGPGKPLDPIVREFVKLILSKEGQEVVLKDGYLPLSAEIVKQELAKLE